MSRFYNPGSLINEKIQYTHPTKDPKEGSTLSYHLFLVGEKDFVDVPDTLTLDTAEGEVTVAVNFAKRIKKDYQSRGMILIDSRMKNILEDDNAATDDKEAKRKGDSMWREYLGSIAREHFAAVDRTRAFGGVPQPATGLTKHALNALKMQDPADHVGTIIAAQEGQVANSETQKQIADLTALVNQLKGALESKRT